MKTKTEKKYFPLILIALVGALISAGIMLVDVFMFSQLEKPSEYSLIIAFCALACLFSIYLAVRMAMETQAIVKTMLTKQRKEDQGFTLIELLTVIVIITILSSVIIVAYIHARDAAWKQKTRDSARQIATAINLYMLANRAYPDINQIYNYNSGVFKTSSTNMMILNSSTTYLEQNAEQRVYDPDHIEWDGPVGVTNGGFRDKWGYYFHVQIDPTYSGTVNNPVDGSPVHANVIVWSMGPYGNTNSIVYACP